MTIAVYWDVKHQNKQTDKQINLFVIIIIPKRPVTPSGVSTALAGSSLIFRNAVRSQDIPDVFLEKAPVTASSQRPRRFYGALVAFYRVPTEFLLGILCALTALL